MSDTLAPAIYEHCQTIFSGMLEESVEEIVDNEPIRVYEGFLTKLFTAHDLSIPYYSHVMKELTRMDCVRQIRRGGGPSPSRWLIVQPPRREAFDSPDMAHNPARRTKMDQMEQQIRDLQALNGELMARVEILTLQMGEVVAFKKRFEERLEATSLKKLESKDA